MKNFWLLIIILATIAAKKNRKKKVRKNRKGVVDQTDGSYLSVGNIVKVDHSPFTVGSTKLDLKSQPDVVASPTINKIVHPFISDYSLVTPEYAKPKTDIINPLLSQEIVQTKDGAKVMKQQVHKAHNLRNDDGTPIQNRVIALHGLDRRK